MRSGRATPRNINKCRQIGLNIVENVKIDVGRS